MFANLKKKIESEVGDLSRLNLRSITQSEKMTPLSSRHNSISSLASETSTSHNKLSSPLGPFDQNATSPQSHYSLGASSSATKQEGTNGGKTMDSSQQKIRRQFEEKVQSMELDFAWRLSSKDEELTKFQKQVDHLSSLLHSKEYETQQKLVRVQEDMDSLEGFSQQENAKIKHLLLNKEEELSQLKAAIMSKDSAISEYESQVKNITADNERLQKSLDEVIGRKVSQTRTPQEDEQMLQEAKLLQEKVDRLEQRNKELETSIKTKDEKLDKLLSELRTSKLEAEAKEKENSLVLRELKDLQLKLNRIGQEREKQESTVTKLEEELLEAKKVTEIKHAELSDALTNVRTLQQQNGDLTLQLAAASNHKEDDPALIQLQSDLASLKSIVSEFEREIQTKELQVQALVKDLSQLKSENDNLKVQFTSEHAEWSRLLEEKSTSIQQLEANLENYKVKAVEMEQALVASQNHLQQVEAKLHNLSMEEEEESNEEKSAIVVHKIAELEKETEQLKSDLEKVNRERAEFECQANLAALDLNSVRENFQAETSQLVQEKQRELDLMKDLLQSVQAELEDKNATVQTLSEEVKMLSLTVENYLDTQCEMDKTSAEHEATIARLKSELANYQKQISEMEAELSSSKESAAAYLSQLKPAQEKVDLLERDKNALHAELKAHISQQSTSDNLVSEKDATICNLQQQLEEFKTSLEKKGIQTNDLQQQVQSLKLSLQEKEQQMRATQEKLTDLVEKSAIKENECSASSDLISQLKSQVEETETTVSQLRSQIEEFESMEVENGDLVLQISEIQSKCDELEEENKFLKEAASQQDQGALKRKISELESDILDKTQMLKQQSLQLQDLRRSLAKEINKNQALSESASPAELVTQSQCNGAMMQSMSNSSIPAATATQPPTLPPQETDVNFMYLRSVIFKYLTTTDVQVTQQLTRVVATLLHLNEEESHLLSQARNNSFFHLKS